MVQRLLPLVALALCLARPAGARAQLTAQEFNTLNQLLAEPDAKPSYEKRLRLIREAMEREADPKPRPGGNIPVDLKRARIPPDLGVPFLLERLDQPSEIASRTALRMLGAYGVAGKAAVPKVLEFLEKIDLGPVCAEAMVTLAQIAPGNKASAVAILERLGADAADDATNWAALQALLAMADVVPKSAVPGIAKFREHRLTKMARHAHELAGKVLSLERPTIEQLRTLTAIDWRESADQGYAIFASIADAGKRAEFAVPLVVAVLDSGPPPYIECVALDTLARVRTGSAQAITALLNRLTTKDVLVRAKARLALQTVDLTEPASVRVLAAGLRHQDRGARLDVALALRRWDDMGRLTPAGRAEMLPRLIETLSELNEEVTPAHLEAYLPLLRRSGTGAAAVADGVFKFYQSEGYFKRLGTYGEQLRGKLLAVLANVGVPESARDVILEVLRKGPTKAAGAGYAYAAAARAAATFADPEQVVPLLVPGLAVKRPERALYFIDWSGDGMGKPTTVRLEAIRALAKMGGAAEEALPQLEDIAETNENMPTDLDFLTRQEARRAYRDIAGEPLPPAKSVFADGKTEKLHLDERLHVKMVLKLRNPRPQDVLKRLQDATKMNFTMSDNIDPDIPVWGSIHSVNMPAWNAMRQMAAAPSIKGTWEDVGDGYRLVGKKRALDDKLAKALAGPKTPFPPFRDDSFDPLPEDPRLKKSVTIRLNNARAEELVQNVRDATGVTLILENVDLQNPLYGSVNWPNIAAWSALRASRSIRASRGPGRRSGRLIACAGRNPYNRRHRSRSPHGPSLLLLQP